MAAQCIVYSFGCDGDFDFERYVAKLHGAGCEIHIFDPLDPINQGIDLPLAFHGVDHVSVTFHNFALMDRDGINLLDPWPHAEKMRAPTFTLPSIMSSLGH